MSKMTRSQVKKTFPGALETWKDGPGLDGGKVEFNQTRRGLTARQELEGGDYVFEYDWDVVTSKWTR